MRKSCFPGPQPGNGPHSVSVERLSPKKHGVKGLPCDQLSPKWKGPYLVHLSILTTVELQGIIQ